jgi:hypothetical protein
MIVWQGYGLLSLIFFVVGGASGILIGTKFLELDGPGVLAAVAVGIVVASLVNWFVGRALNKRSDNRKALNGHSMFLVPMEWWSLGMIAVAVYLLAPVLMGRA